MNVLRFYKCDFLFQSPKINKKKVCGESGHFGKDQPFWAPNRQLMHIGNLMGNLW